MKPESQEKISPDDEKRLLRISYLPWHLNATVFVTFDFACHCRYPRTLEIQAHDEV
jgi:hypothetical protein